MDEYFMNQALAEAQKAFDMEEVPVGAVIVKDNNIIAKGYNLKESLGDCTCHGEIIAIREACKALGGWRLSDCDMYVTLEPCPMCAGALVQARIRRLIIGTPDPKSGAAGSVLNILQDDRLNHRVEITWGVMQEQCSQILKDFFKSLRKNK
jgi:tRNA(adenine34) deaminase